MRTKHRIEEVLEIESSDEFVVKKVHKTNENAAADYIEYVDNKGLYLHFHYDNNTKEASLYSVFTQRKGYLSVIIPDCVLGYVVTRIGERCYLAHEENIVSVCLPNTLKSIGNYAFRGLINLESITIPESVIEIGDEAFAHCALTKVFIPRSVTSIGNGVFMGCDRLVSIIIDKHNSVYDSRKNCNAIVSKKENKIIAGCKTTQIPQSVLEIGDKAFEDCDLLKIKFPNTLIKIGNDAFRSCAGLSQVFIPKSISHIASGCFAGCKRLSSIKVSKSNQFYDSRGNCNAIIETATNILVQGCYNTWIPDNITKIGANAFEGCDCFSSIVIPNSVTEIEANAFAQCYNLEEVVLSDSITKIGENAFSNTCLFSLEIPSSLTQMDFPYFDNKHLHSIKVDADNRVYDSRDNCNAIIETQTNKLILGCKNTIIPDSVEEIDYFAFSFTKIEEISIPKSVHTINQFAFLWCFDLKRIMISDPSLLADTGLIDVVEIISPNQQHEKTQLK